MKPQKMNLEKIKIIILDTNKHQKTQQDSFTSKLDTN